MRSLRASTHPGVICRGRRHSGLEYPDEKSNGTSCRTLLLHLCILNNAAIAVIHATNSIGIINKPFVEFAGFLEALESVIIPQMERFRPQLLIISGTSRHMHPSIDSFFHSTISSIHPSTHPSHLFIHQSIRIFIHPSHRFILPPIHPSIHPFILNEGMKH